MIIIGCDFHASFQEVAIFEEETGEISNRRLGQPEEAKRFYETLCGRVRVGMEACGFSRWFEDLVNGLGHELWMGDAGQIRATVVRKQKTDRRDAEQLLRLMLEGRFPRIWVPSAKERDLRQLLVHRHQRVRMRTQVKNQLQAVALNQGVRRKRKLWNQAGRQELEKLPLPPFTARRRQELLSTLDTLDQQIAELDRVVESEARKRPEAAYLMTHPGVGPNTALALVLTLGPVERFHSAKQVSSYLGLIPREHSSGGRQRLGRISKQGSSFVRFLLVEAGQTAARREESLQRCYRRWSARIGRSKAKVAIARKLATRLYWMLRNRRVDAQL
jgi:transposase